MSCWLQHKGYLLGLIVSYNAHMRQHLSLQDLPGILYALLPCHTHRGTTLANVVKSHLEQQHQYIGILTRVNFKIL